MTSEAASVRARRARMLAGATLVAIGLAACSSTDSGASGPLSAEDAAAVDQAKVEVENYTSNPPLVVEPLSKAPEKGMKVASVTCTVNSCHPGQFEEAATALGWESTEYTYDLAQGPSGFVTAVRQALQAKPEALAILFVYPTDVIAAEIEQAKADGVVLVDVASALEAPPEGFVSCVNCAPVLAANGKAEAAFITADAGAATEVGVVGDKTIDANRIAGGATTDELARISPNTAVHDINVGYAKTPQENSQTIIAALQRNPNIDYLAFQSPDLMPGVDQALGAAGLSDRVKVVSIDPSGESQVAQLEQGMPNVWIGGDGPAYWWRAADALARNSVGDRVDPAPVASIRVITQDNLQLDMYAPPNYKAAFQTAWGVGG
nr:hypothetical protein [Rhodococcus sp. (in: high G+C Gram-positive bacteria)]